ncbi:MAG TPA: phosphate ABC transporter permease PstA [Candidatus Binatia bacterium]|jgi:phosphate transport system permease protein
MSLAAGSGYAGGAATTPRRRRTGGATTLRAFGEPLLWLTSGGLAISLMMIFGLLVLVFAQGLDTFWPVPVTRIETADGKVSMGEVTRIDSYVPDDAIFAALPDGIRDKARAQVAATGGRATRRLVRIGNFELTGEHFRWIDDFAVTSEQAPAWAMVVERREWGRFYGELASFTVDGNVVATTPGEILAKLAPATSEAAARWQQRRTLEVDEIGRLNRDLEQSRLAVRSVDRRYGRRSPEHDAAAAASTALEEKTSSEFADIHAKIAALNAESARYALVLRTGDGKEQKLALATIVRAYPANQLTGLSRIGVYASRWWEFLTDVPREANSEGGVFPAIFGTVAMTLLMSLLVTPFGVLAALYLREYARGGLVVSAVRIAINNLAGVPSIVFGVFGLGFFCYIVGAGIDQVFFPDKLPTPTFGTGGILWASLTLALLTLPVVIVATEEALAAVPNSMREGSYACGASKWQTIRRIVLPRALPGILTGMILAIARGAGEVAPLMLVGAVKLAPELPVDGVAPFVHLQRSFMHLGFHIYDVGFQSQNSEAAKPMVYTTTLLLIVLIASLNLATIWLRARLRRRFVASQF